jgi:ribonuclease D
MVETLSHEPILAVDSESNSLYAYHERVCLIQFSSPTEDYLVDPLALSDLSPLATLFANPNIEKVFHAAEYDLITLKRDFGFTFANLFDTMIAARILGVRSIGLGSLLEAEFGVHLDKRYQRANWGQRPLPSHLLEYARLDTHYLIPLRNRLCDRLQETSRWLLAQEDFTRLPQVNGRAVECNGELCWRINGAYDLTPRQAAVLEELCRYRDRVAQRINCPPFKVINDQILYAIAVQCPTTMTALRSQVHLSEKVLERHGEALLRAVQRGLKAKPLYPPHIPAPNEHFLCRLEALRQWRKTAAQRMGVSSEVILPRDLLYALAYHNPHTHQDLAALLCQVPWRLKHFGDEILTILAQVEAMEQATT